MSNDLESRLRAALRPVAASAELEKKLIARVVDQQQYARPIQRRARWLAAAAAASLLIAAGVQLRVQEQRERENGLEARRQVVEALHMTSQKLDLAYETVKSQSTSLADADPGA